MKYILFLSFLLLGFQLKSQESTDPSMLIKINDVLPYYNFESIRSYVWTDGDRKTYCPNYSDNPHFKLTEINTEIYFNPSTQKENLTESDYNVIFITSKLKGLPFNYYLYLTDSADIYLYDYNKTLKDDADKKEALDKLRKIIDLMMTTSTKQ